LVWSGELKVKPLTDDVKRFETIKNILIDVKGNLQEAKITKARYYKDLVMIYLDGVDTIEKAEEYKGYYIKIRREDAPKLNENEYFIVDLLDLEVYTENDELLGKIVDIFPTRKQWCLCCKKWFRQTNIIASNKTSCEKSRY